MIDAQPRRPVRIRRGATGAAVLAAAFLFALPATGQTAGTSRNSDRRGEIDPSQLQMRGSIQLSEEQLALAGTIRPVAKEALEALMPERLGALPRTSMSGFTRSFGPMSVTFVKSVFESGTARIEVEIMDPGGMPAEGDPILPDGIEAQGEDVSLVGQWADGFAGTLKSERAKNASTYQLRLGPRLRLTLRSDAGTGPTLRDAARQLDLPALAALAPQAPPSLGTGDGAGR